VKIVSKINNPQIDFPNIFSPDTIFLDKENISFGRGNLICSRCLFSCNVHIGDFNTFNGFITIGHDTNIGSFNSLMPAVRISGEVSIGERNFFGVSSVVLQRIKIGNDTVIGANSTILRKTKDGNTYVGNPALIVKY
jgi:acetyltransferase-like isoleucine patch superfamily enzyme